MPYFFRAYASQIDKPRLLLLPIVAAVPMVFARLRAKYAITEEAKHGKNGNSPTRPSPAESKDWLWSKLPPTWAQLLGPERLQSPSFVRLSQKAEAAYRKGRVAPEEHQIFAALEAVHPADVKVVILGQDPYHTPGKATGLAFSVPARFGLRDSVANIHQEIKADLGSVDARTGTGDLSHWASQGVLLLNTALTVRHGEANSHRGLGWKVFVETLLQLLSRQTTNIVWLLWGAQAQRYQRVIRNAAEHRILKAVHPSPLSARRGFFGCKHFSQANAYLVQKGRGPIGW